MSMTRCDSCDNFIDSDEDPDCYVENPKPNDPTHHDCLCVWCREELPELSGVETRSRPFRDCVQNPATMPDAFKEAVDRIFAPMIEFEEATPERKCEIIAEYHKGAGI